jgi:hypothetical protein
MSNSVASSGKGNAEAYTGVDKQALWGWWKKGVDEQQDLYLRMVERAMDMPPKPQGFNAPQKHHTVNGISGWQLAALGLLGLTGLGGLRALGVTALKAIQPPPAPQWDHTPHEPVQGAATLELLDADGNVLELEEWPPRR